MKPIALTTSLCLAAFSTSAQADITQSARSYFTEHASAWLASPEIIEAIRASNAAHSTLSQADIEALDTAWRTEVGTATTPTIAPVLTSPASDFLRQQVAAAEGTVTEIIVMDAVGLNVAISEVTSDFWQGDEDKHSATYGAGAGSINVSDVELDESTQTYQVQVSGTVVDPADGSLIGAVTIGLNAEAIE